MTICIGAIAERWHDPKIVLCSDTRIEIQDFASADTGQKLGWVSRHWLALLAGNMTAAKELVNYYQDYLNEQPDSMDLFEATAQLRVPPERMKKDRIQQHLSMKWGMSFDEFTTKGSQAIPQDLYHATWREIESIQLQCELILVGFVGSQPALFSFDDHLKVGQCEHFATIGSGSWVAKAAMFQRGCHEKMSLEEVAYCVYEAKRLSEIAPGVGKETQMIIIAHTPEGVVRRMKRIDDSEMSALESGYRSLGLKKFKGRRLAIRPPLAEPTPAVTAQE